MIVVLFEATPEAGHDEAYFDLAASLRAELEKIPGFVSVERFRSVQNPEKLLSLSVWENEDAVKAWRTAPQHQEAQKMGREQIFRHYEIRVARVLRAYGVNER